MTDNDVTWDEIRAWCSRQGHSFDRLQRDVLRCRHQAEAKRWSDEMKRLSDAAGPHLTGAAWMANSRAFDEARKKHDAAVARAFP